MEQWISAKDVSEMTGCCRPNAQKIIRTVNEEIRSTGGLVPSKTRAPKEMVLAKLYGTKENR